MGENICKLSNKRSISKTEKELIQLKRSMKNKQNSQIHFFRDLVYDLQTQKQVEWWLPGAERREQQEDTAQKTHAFSCKRNKFW